MNTRIPAKPQAVSKIHRKSRALSKSHRNTQSDFTASIAQRIAQLNGERAALRGISIPTIAPVYVGKDRWGGWPRYALRCPACSARIAIYAGGDDRDNPTTTELLDNCPECSDPLRVDIPPDVRQAEWLRLERIGATEREAVDAALPAKGSTPRQPKREL